MVTSYTNGLHNGDDVTFADFVMECAKAFGDLSEVNNGPDELPDMREYYTGQLKQAEGRLMQVEAWDTAEAKRQAELSYRQRLLAYESTLANRKALRARYQQMLDKATAWTPPAAEYGELRDFMIEQLNSSIYYDCDIHDGPTLPEQLSAKAYRQQQLDLTQQQITKFTRGLSDAKQEARTRTERAQAKAKRIEILRRSLTNP